MPVRNSGPVRPGRQAGENVPHNRPRIAFDGAVGLWGAGRKRRKRRNGGNAFLRFALARARVVEPHWSRLLAAHDVDSAYLYAKGADCDYRARMYSPTAGIPEDPATGSASAILAAQLLANGAVPDGTTRLILHQGVEMGRPSTLRLTIEAAGGALTRVRIAGSAVRIGEGRLTPP